MKNKLKAQAGIIKLLRSKTGSGTASGESKTNDKKAPVNSPTEDTNSTTIDAKLEKFSANLLTKVTQIVDAKLSVLSTSPGTSYADKTRDDTKHAVSAGRTPPTDFASVMRETKNDEFIEQQERHRRANNTLIYGMNENSADNAIPLKSKDALFITDLMEVLDTDVVPSSITRLGKPSPGKHCPVKLTMSCASDKELIMGNLKKLKDADEVYRSLSIRDDYTIKERELIGKYTAKAKQKNEAENTTEWKVGGTSKNGLRVMRITKR